jgi:hypothetical protein
MRTSFLIALSLVITFLTSDGFAQGTVNFGNRPLVPPPDRLVRDVSGQPIVGENFVAQLLYETAPDSFTPHPVLASFDSNPALAGYWQGGLRSLVGAGGIFVPVRLQVRVWDGAPGVAIGGPLLTFEEAVAAGNQWGNSEIFTYIERQSVPADPSDRFMLEFRGFQLVPEPGTWALLALGFGVLFWKCRRRQSS